MRASFLLLISLLIALPVRAEDAPPKRAFDVVIKKATGRNGYEELVLAADMLHDCKPWKKLELAPEATLAEKRAVLADKQVAQALRLFQQGLRKPVAAPRDTANFDTLLPELAEFRSMARLLAVQEYVQLADGHVSDALGTLRLGLKFGQVIQTDTLISGLVGVAIEAVVIQPIGAHLDQLSARESEALFRLCLDWLRQPSPELKMLEMERRNVHTSLEEMRRESPDRLVESLGLDPKPGPDDDAETGKRRALAAELRQMGGQSAMDRLIDGTLQHLDAYYDKLAEQLRLPLWQRHYPHYEPDGTLAAGLVGQLVPVFNQVGNGYGRERAKIEVLACHAAILRYRWEHNRVPQSLEELRLGELALDPFNGQLLDYQPLGPRTYRLVSVGPEGDPTNPKAVNGRIPVGITPGD